MHCFAFDQFFSSSYQLESKGTRLAMTTGSSSACVVGYSLLAHLCPALQEAPSKEASERL